jgi:hypothetical protein
VGDKEEIASSAHHSRNELTGSFTRLRPLAVAAKGADVEEHFPGAAAQGDKALALGVVPGGDFPLIAMAHHARQVARQSSPGMILRMN